MKKMRPKLFLQTLENKLAQYERRIQKMAENAYRIRQAIENIQMENKRALYQTNQQGSIGSGSVDNGTGGVDVSDSATVETVLEK